jgi:hypothetical protein
MKTDSRQLALVKLEAFEQVLLSVVRNLDNHETFLRMSAFACSHGVKPDSPSATLRRRSSRIFLCQSGDSTPSGERDKSSQRSSIASSFSWRVISSNGKVIAINQEYLRAAHSVAIQPLGLSS